MSELNMLLENMDEAQLEVMAAVAVRIAGVKAERWTGKVLFEVNANQGSMGDLHVNKGEVVRIGGRKRKVRNRGID